MTSAEVDLSGSWTLREVGASAEVPCPLPGDAITALAAAGAIPEPYRGRNEYECRWVAERDWEMRRTFDPPEGTGWVLEADGLDTVAEVAINGEPVLKADNAFRRWRVPLRDDLFRSGGNEVVIRFPSALAEADRRQASQPFPVPYHEGNSPLANGNMLRKPQCDFGWDWNAALAPFGLWGKLRLIRAPHALPAAVAVRQEHGAGRVTLQVTVSAERTAEGTDPVPFSAAFAGETREGVLEHGAGDRATVRFTVEEPALWWPAGWGAQPLHDLVTVVDGHEERRRIGLRTVELVSEPDAAGRSFGLRVNRRDLFCRGANWIPADALSGRITQEGVRDLLQSAVDANMNMIRVWGGGRYEPDWFYDLCDEMGLLVWQDAMFACHLYPSEDAFLAEIWREVHGQAARLQHHACLALWCGDNELIGALTWYPESRENRDRYLVAYDRLNRTVEGAVRAGDPGANWWPSSPSPGPMSYGDAWHDDGSGDMHFWSVWHEGRDFEHYRDVAPRFCSEFGFQSYPSMDVIRRFADPADWNIAAPVMESHQKNAGGNARIAETMFRYFRFPNTFEDFVWLSQLQQALAIKTAVTHWRSLKPHCMGALYWQLNDTWPCCSWSSLDHGGGWKLLHHFARGFYAPVTVVAVPDEGAVRLVGINDRLEPETIAVTAYATGLQGAAREIGGTEKRIGEASATILTVPLDTLGPDELLTFGWTSATAKGGDIHAPRHWKSYDLPDAKPRFVAERDGDAWRLELSADAMSLFLTAEADIAGRWDRNAVHLGPGVSPGLRFTPHDAQIEPRFVLRDLRSATYTQGNHP